MTRMNTLPPRLLLNKQLLDEYRESVRPINKLAKGETYKNIPDTFGYGAGHESFFGDKALYLHRRHRTIRMELKARRFAASGRFKGPYTICTDEAIKLVPAELCNDWKPTKADHLKCVDRLVERFFQYKNKSYRGNTEINADNIWSHWLVDVANAIDACSEVWDIMCKYRPGYENSNNAQIQERLNEISQK